MTVLKYARLTDREIVLKLIGGRPARPTGPGVGGAHTNAILRFEELANVLSF